MSLKSFKNKQNDKLLVPKLFTLSYSLMAVGVLIYFYAFFSEHVPCGKNLYYPDWEIFKGGSQSCDFGHFTISDKETIQLYLIGPFFVFMGSMLKLLGLSRQ